MTDEDLKIELLESEVARLEKYEKAVAVLSILAIGGAVLGFFYWVYALWSGSLKVIG